MIRAGSSRRENRSEKKSLVADGGMRVDRRRRKVLTSLVQRHEKIEREREKYIYFFKNKYIYIRSGRHPWFICRDQSVRSLSLPPTLPVGPPPVFQHFSYRFSGVAPPPSSPTHKIWISQRRGREGEASAKKAHIKLILVISLFSSCLFVTVINLLLLLLCMNVFFWETKKNLLKISVTFTTQNNNNNNTGREIERR